ncbi:MAG: universal stress protein [Gemmatimonadota bacterium]
MVPLDGSALAEAATGPAARLAARHGIGLHLARVVSNLPPAALAVDAMDLAARWIEDEEARASAYLEEVKSRISAEPGALDVSAHVRVGPTAKSLVGLAGELKVSLIVLTTHGRGAWERAWFGSVADQLLRTAPIPLLLLRAGTDASRVFADESYPRHVFVPLDGSLASEEILVVLPRILSENERRVTLATILHRPVSVPPLPVPNADSGRDPLRDEEMRARRYLERLGERLRADRMGRVELLIKESTDVARSLLESCAHLDVDLIALSTRGRGAVGRFFVGSVADKVIRGSETAVLAVCSPDREDEG